MNGLSEKSFKSIFDSLHRESVIQGDLGITGWSQMCDAMEGFGKNEGFRIPPEDGEDHIISKEEYPECYAFMAGARWGAEWIALEHKSLFSKKGSEQEELVKLVERLESKLEAAESKIKQATSILKR